jgi:hypothetical protein
VGPPPFGAQLKPIYDMAEFVAVRHPMRPIRTGEDRSTRATVDLFRRSTSVSSATSVAAGAQRVGARFLLQ